MRRNSALYFPPISPTATDGILGGGGQSGHFVDYLISHPKVKDHWRDYTNHEFVNQLGAGTLDKESFKYYLMQDYLFLVRISRPLESAS